MVFRQLGYHSLASARFDSDSRGNVYLDDLLQLVCGSSGHSQAQQGSQHTGACQHHRAARPNVRMGWLEGV